MGLKGRRQYKSIDTAKGTHHSNITRDKNDENNRDSSDVSNMLPSMEALTLTPTHRNSPQVGFMITKSLIDFIVLLFYEFYDYNVLYISILFFSFSLFSTDHSLVVHILILIDIYIC
jgi:hypothetical protein